jgi:hypothetical protein
MRIRVGEDDIFAKLVSGCGKELAILGDKHKQTVTNKPVASSPNNNPKTSKHHGTFFSSTIT